MNESGEEFGIVAVPRRFLEQAHDEIHVSANIVVEDGPYEFADAPAPDVLLIVPRIVDLDIPAPETNNPIGVKQYTPGPVKMQVIGEMRDASSNTLVARVIVFEGQERYGINDFRLANRVTNSHEMRMGFAKWSRMALEALNVAKAGQPLK